MSLETAPDCNKPESQGENDASSDDLIRSTEEGGLANADDRNRLIQMRKGGHEKIVYSLRKHRPELYAAQD